MRLLVIHASPARRYCAPPNHPAYAFVRRSGFSPEDSMDHTQEFFARILSRGDFAKADP